jgi:hypothetical protein
MASGYSEEVQMLPVANLTLTEAQAAALTGIAISASGATGGTVTINESHTTAEVWQYYRQWIAQTANFDSEDTWTFDGSVLNIGAWNVTVTGSGVVLSGDQLTTSGALTLSSGGTVTLNKYATMSGIMVLGSVSGLVAGSRVQIYNVTDATEMLNAVVAGTSTSFYVAYTSDKSIRVRVTHISRAEWDNTGTLTVNGFSFNAALVVCPVYAENGIDGSTVTEFSTDLANVQIDISDGDGVTSLQRLFAWYRYTVTTESGIQHIYKGIGASDASNYTINSSVIDLKLDNVSASPVRISGGYLSATDGDTVIAATSGSIQMDAGKAFVANSATIVSDLNSIKAHTALIPTLI